MFSHFWCNSNAGAGQNGDDDPDSERATNRGSRLG